MSDIFVSYAREDKRIAKQIVDALKKAGWSVWWDPELQAGEHWDRAIETELANARCVVVIWSEHSVSKDWVLNEAMEAHEQRKLIPVSVAQVRPPLAFRRLQYADLTGWEGNAGDPRLQKLIQLVEAFVSRTATENQSAGSRNEVSDSRTAGPDRRSTVRYETILPGIGTDSLKLNATATAVVALLGRPSKEHSTGPDATIQGQQLILSYHDIGLRLVFWNAKLQRLDFVSAQAAFEPYLGQTPQGVSLESTENDIVRAYGEPQTDRKRRVFKYPGIDFTLATVSRRIVEIGVETPRY